MVNDDTRTTLGRGEKVAAAASGVLMVGGLLVGAWAVTGAGALLLLGTAWYYLLRVVKARSQ
jgi:hypothetical protein